MASTSSDLPNFQIKQDDKFFNRLMSKESSMADPSFRVYYGGSTGSVPFKWESQPGTPKHALSDTSLPPLTPPPSYYSKQSYQKPTKKHNARSKVLSLMLPKFGLRKIKNVITSSSSSSPPSSPSISSSSSRSSSHSFMMMTPNYSSKYQRRSRFYSFDYGTDYEREGVSAGSPTSITCFGINRTNSTRARGCYIW